MIDRRWWAAATAVLYAALVAVTWNIDGREAHAASEFRPFRQPAVRSKKRRRPSQAHRRKKVPYRKIRRTQSGYFVDYGFKNFNGDKLSVQANLDASMVAASIREFGFRRADFKKLDAWYQRTQKKTLDTANRRFISGKVTGNDSAELKKKLRFVKDMNRSIQKDLDRQLDALAKEYRKRRLRIYKAAGFRYKDKKTVEIDIPAMVRRNWKRVRPIANGFAKIARSKRYDQEDLVAATTAWVQTSLRYEVPDENEGSRTIAGIMPPLKALILGQGDCDTKTALLAAVLLNWPKVRMVGLGIPGHYLMAYQRAPRRGDIYIEYQGIPYVMIESAGPAWLPPGEVGQGTQDYLSSGRNFRIQPLTG